MTSPLTPIQSTYEPLTREQIDVLRRQAKAALDPDHLPGRYDKRVDALCDMAVNSLLYAEEIQRLRDAPVSETRATKTFTNAAPQADPDSKSGDTVSGEATPAPAVAAPYVKRYSENVQFDKRGETPRTDEEVELAKKYPATEHGLWVSAEFARQLERELTNARIVLQAWQSAFGEQGFRIALRQAKDGIERDAIQSAMASNTWAEVEKAKADAYEDAARRVEKIAEDYTHEHGSYDPSTNAWELHHRHADRIEALDDAVEAIRKRKAEKCQVTQAASQYVGDGT